MLADGHVSPEAALRDYGVVVTDTLTLDEAATAGERTARTGSGPSDAAVCSSPDGIVRESNLSGSPMARAARQCSS